MELAIRCPYTPAEWQQYYYLRWLILRAPLGQSLGTEQDELEDSAWHLAAFYGEEVIAIGRLQANSEAIGQIRYMAVKEKYQRQGIGHRLLTALEQIARQQGMSQMVLNARETAVPFYVTANYSLLGEGPLLFGQIKHTIMSKLLG
ncbi:GNAT family N-acetyltransferase [Agitococcus lubricus]|uniref:Acetyltransferase (GNAT) family protein n=1 Tax=Agitococcus lubricus TaxID=1077255 RepID=A0A2T5IWH3_9GAMM|nr:GNAT family N-acetyltransferase [Agitococcus lubricus]PTQ88251.1 acetyltransferase (GNAT) family protein [Agitococcus lubricus]